MFSVDDIKTIPDERLRKIISEVFDAIIKKYGERNFFRWINEAKIDNKVKSLIFKYIDEKSKPNFGGYYSPIDNAIAVQEEYNDLSTYGVVIHEFNHFLTAENFEEEMSGFINEGITEYLKQSVDQKSYKTYEYNVDFVAFLHKLIGDSLIKSYFTGDTTKVKSKLASYLEPTKLNDFLFKLKSIYSACYDKNYEEKSKVLKENLNFFVESYMKIYLGKISEDAEKMAFYSDGNINRNKITRLLSEINSVFPKYIIDYMNENNMMQPYKEQITRTILEKSHLKHTDYYSDDNLEKYIDIIMNRKNIQIPNDNAIQTLLFDRLKNKNLNINEYADIILMVLNKFPDFPIENLNKMEFLRVMVGDDKFDLVCDYVKANIGRYYNIDKFIEEHKKNTIESYFRTISPNWLYLEKRDNKLYIIKVEYDGKIKDVIPVDKVDENNRFYLEHYFINDEEYGYCLPAIILDDDFSKIKIYPSNEDDNSDEVYDLKAFGQVIKTTPFFNNIRMDINKNKKIDKDAREPFFGLDGVWYKINNAGVRRYDDYRTIHIDLEGLKKDLNNILLFFPKENSESIIKKLLKEYLKNIYNLDFSIEIDWAINELYQILYNNEDKRLVSNIEGSLNNLKNEKNDFVSSKYKLAFKDKETEEEYYKRKKEYEIKEERSRKYQEEKEKRKQEKEKLENFEKDNKYGYLIYQRTDQHTNPNAGFDLPWKHLPQSRREPGYATINVDKLINKMKEYIEICSDKKDYKPFVTSTIDFAIKQLLEVTDTEEAKKIYDSLFNMIYDDVCNNKELDKEQFEELINRSNEYISKHAGFWPVYPNIRREDLIEKLNELYKIMGPNKIFEKISRQASDYVIKHGYDDYIISVVQQYIDISKGSLSVESSSQK